MDLVIHFVVVGGRTMRPAQVIFATQGVASKGQCSWRFNHSVGIAPPFLQHPMDAPVSVVMLSINGPQFE